MPDLADAETIGLDGDGALNADGTARVTNTAVLSSSAALDERFAGAAPAAEGTPPATPAPAAVVAPPPTPKPDAPPLIAAPPVAALPDPNAPTTAAAVAFSMESHTLPPNVRGNTAEAFAKVKAAASAEITRISAELAARDKDLSELRLKAGTAVTPELQKELVELRAFRERMAQVGDPVFESKYSKPIAEVEDGIYAVLREHGANDADIEAVKKLGLDGVDWQELYNRPGSKPTLRSAIERRFIRRDELLEAKQKAVVSVESSSVEWRKQRAVEIESQDRSRLTTAAQGFDNVVAGLTLMNPALPPNADEATKVQHAGLVQYLNTSKEQVRSLLLRGDPDALAELAASAALTASFRAQSEGASARLKMAEGVVLAAQAAQKTAEAKVVALEADLAAVRKATTFRTGFQAGGAPRPAASLPPKPGDIRKGPDQALEEYAREHNLVSAG